MATSQTDAAATSSEPHGSSTSALVAGGVLALTVLAGYFAFGFLTKDDGSKLLQVPVAVLLGAIGVWVAFWAADQLVSALPGRLAERVRPYVFVGPAMSFLAFYLVYPVVQTIILSLKDRKGNEFVGLDNYERVLTESQYLIGLRNSAAWVIVVPFFAVVIGLAFATMADKLSKRAESVTKSLIFLPMAISFVGASVVFTFIFSFRPEGFGEQIGLLNAIWTQFGEPKNWLIQKPWNNLYLMIILVWLQTGFAMVILSSAIKGVASELLEAARIDGATEWQVFTKVVLPSIASTLVVVWTTVVITVWKVFDIVWVMTGGRDDTQIVAQQMVREFFTNNDSGTGAALAVLLFVAVTPVLAVNVRRFKAEEAMR